MPTDDERREVARRLREQAEAHPNMSLLLNVAFADDGLRPEGAMEWEVSPHDAAMRLADLIEPEAPTSSDTAPTCDRDALLALADDLDYAGANVENVACIDQAFRDTALRIREAVGA